MMTEIVRYKYKHLSHIKRQKFDEKELADMTEEQYKAAESLKHCYTIMVNLKPVACVGIVEYWKNRGEAFALISSDCGDNFVSIVRAMKQLIADIDCARIEATVVRDFKQAHRLVKLLGFELEADLMRKYGVTGLDYSLYARVK